MTESIFNFSLLGVMETLPLAFIIIIVVFALTIMLRSLIFLGVQSVIVLAMYIFDLSLHPVFEIAAIVIQFALAIFLVYKYFQALERNYQLVLEKIHQAPRHLTKKNAGAEKTFM